MRISEIPPKSRFASFISMRFASFISMLYGDLEQNVERCVIFFIKERQTYYILCSYQPKYYHYNLGLVGCCEGTGLTFQCRDVLRILMIGHGPTALALSRDGGCLDIFLSSIHLFFLLLIGRLPQRAV